mgnify:CR=1 FL=1
MTQKISYLLLLTFILMTSLSAEEYNSLPRDKVAELLDNIIEHIETKYVDVEAGTKVIAGLRENLANGAYDDLHSEIEFADVVTEDLRLLSNDLHLSVRLANTPSNKAGQTGRRMVKKGAQSDHFEGRKRPEGGFFRGEVLPGGVGLVEFTSVLPPFEVPGVREDLQRALKNVADESHIIFDARKCRGGVPETVANISSNLYGMDNVLLNTYVNRNTGNHELYTNSSEAVFDGSEKIFYVLTSSGTGSGAEAFAYLNQQHHRITVVGEQTAGAGRASVFYPINENLNVLIPENESIHPVSKGNFEKVGVTPDVKVDHRLALYTAHELALKEKRSKRPWSFALRKALRNLQLAKEQIQLSLAKAAELTRKSPFAGLFEGDRKIWLDAKGDMLYQRGRSVVFNLVPRGENLYELGMPTDSHVRGKGRELPALSFEYGETKEVTAIAFLFSDGRRDGPFHKVES